MIGRKRKRTRGDAGQSEPEQAGGTQPVPERPAQSAESAPPAEQGPDRTDGPFDVTEVDQPDAAAAARLDLGALQVAMTDGIEVRIEMDPQSEEPVGLIVARGEGAVQVRVFAAPKSGGGWQESRTQIRKSIAADGATVDEVAGPFGTELYATVPVSDEAGRRGMQRMRFIGVDGPRWMLQATLYGAGAVPEHAAPLEEVFRSMVVVRGEQALPPGTALPLTMPQQVPEHIVAVSDDEE